MTIAELKQRIKEGRVPTFQEWSADGLSDYTEDVYESVCQMFAREAAAEAKTLPATITDRVKSGEVKEYTEFLKAGGQLSIGEFNSLVAQSERQQLVSAGFASPEIPKIITQSTWDSLTHPEKLKFAEIKGSVVKDQEYNPPIDEQVMTGKFGHKLPRGEFENLKPQERADFCLGQGRFAGVTA